ncbi:MAG: Mur ligase family protein [Patescibacteria group bacterium]|nr:Mur ligase family protein [Patescibacteria group bacterium]
MKYLYSIYHYFWALVSAVLFWFPSHKIRVIGVTGTKGKTTTVALLAHVFSSVGKQSAYLSSAFMSDGTNSIKNKTSNSMPGRFFIQRFLRQSVRAGSVYAFIEVTSQGVVQHRHKFISWAGAVFLDIHPEHIESHGSFKKYLQAKLSFFTYAHNHSRNTVFYIHKNDSHADDFIRAAGDSKKILFSTDDLFDIPDCSALPGDFNKINIAAMYAVAREEGIAHRDIIQAPISFLGVSGRMEFVVKEPFEVVVDYAHTPDSLEAVYAFLRARVDLRGTKLICVLGSAGGGRDTWKRPAMGKLAGNYCDEIVLTNEDPFNEDPDRIIDMVFEGVRQGSKYAHARTHRVLDRKEAITKAVSLAQPGDVVVCTGKGSESYIRVKRGKKIEWSEREAVLEAQRGYTQI